MKHREGAPTTREGSGRTGMMEELIDAGEGPERIIARVREVLDQDEIERMLHTSLSNDLAKVMAARTKSIMRNAVPGRRKIPERDTSARDAFVEQALAHDIEREPGDRLSRRANLLKQGFKVRGVGFVTWGDATEAHHALKLEQLKALSGGIFETAVLHVRAISEIKAAGVATLNDVAALRHANEKAIEAPVPA